MVLVIDYIKILISLLLFFFFFTIESRVHLTRFCLKQQTPTATATKIVQKSAPACPAAATALVAYVDRSLRTNTHRLQWKIGPEGVGPGSSRSSRRKETFILCVYILSGALVLSLSLSLSLSIFPPCLVQRQLIMPPALPPALSSSSCLISF